MTSAPLSDDERAILDGAGTSDSPTLRQQAVTIVLSKRDDDVIKEARDLLAAGYVRATQPSFHLIPRGDAMLEERRFHDAHAVLSRATTGFTDVTIATLTAAMLQEPASLVPLRMILGMTQSEFAVATHLSGAGPGVGAGAIKNFERNPLPADPTAAWTAKRQASALVYAVTALRVMDRSILQVPPDVAGVFHSKLDKRDTLRGWATVATDDLGVPYSVLLYQRYVGGVWRQVQDAYSEVKGDNVLEIPISRMFDQYGVTYHRTETGARGAAVTSSQFGLSPGPDFVVPRVQPTVIIESKVLEDGGTARDKTARLKNMADAGTARGFTPVAVVDGKGWRGRINAMADVVIATQGRTYTLKTLTHMLEIPHIKSLITHPDGDAPVAALTGDEPDDE